MKKYIVSLLMLCICGAANAQLPSLSNWSGFDPSVHDGAYVPNATVANQLNGNLVSSCHGYALYQAMGLTLPINIYHPGRNDLRNLFWIEDPNGLVAPNGQIVLIEVPKEDATHIIWHNPNILSGQSGLDNAMHTAIFSQFDGLPRSLDYCQSANGLSPAIVVHLIGAYQPNQNYDIKYYKFKLNNVPIPLNYQPITPSSIFSCGVFVQNDVVTHGGNDGELIAFSTASGPSTSRTYNWSDGSQAIINSNLCSGSYTVTVTETPTNYTCIASEVLGSGYSIFDKFTYTPHTSGINCAGNSGYGSASIKLASGLNLNDFSYSWDGNANFQQSITATGLCYGLYNVTITSNSTGCSEVHTADVPVGFGPMRLGANSNLEEVNESSNAPILSVKSNTVRGSIIINGVNDAIVLKIHDMNGRLIQNTILYKSSEEVNLGSIGKGFYLLSLTNQKGELLHHEKLILN